MLHADFRILTDNKMKPIGRNYYNPEDAVRIPQHGLDQFCKKFLNVYSDGQICLAVSIIFMPSTVKQLFQLTHKEYDVNLTCFS
jgi:hypothetical protein